jgi:hypothetical protein
VEEGKTKNKKHSNVSHVPGSVAEKTENKKTTENKNKKQKTKNAAETQKQRRGLAC